MKEFERVQIESRAELRAWLEANHTREESIWLVSFKKQVADKYVSWDEVVEERARSGSQRRCTWRSITCGPTIRRRVNSCAGRGKLELPRRIFA
jgi:hypothetical protein